LVEAADLRGGDDSSGPAWLDQARVGTTTLVKREHDPLEDFVKVQFERTSGLNVGRHHNAGETETSGDWFRFH